MKAIIIILAASIVIAAALKLIDQYTSLNGVRSVGAKANRQYKGMAKLNINDEEELKEALKAYKDLID